MITSKSDLKRYLQADREKCLDCSVNTPTPPPKGIS